MTGTGRSFLLLAGLSHIAAFLSWWGAHVKAETVENAVTSIPAICVYPVQTASSLQCIHYAPCTNNFSYCDKCLLKMILPQPQRKQRFRYVPQNTGTHAHIRHLAISQSELNYRTVQQISVSRACISPLWYDMIYLTAIALTSVGSSTVHIYTNNT
jgi:hypothetical protein